MKVSVTDRIGRRDLLRLGARTAAALPGVALLLAACQGQVPSVRRSSVALPSSGEQITMPIRPDLEIPSGLPIERGATLKVFEWREYLSKVVLDEFLQKYRRYDITYEVRSFESRPESLARIRRPDADYDVFFPTVDAIGGLVAEGLLRPLNHDYLPNLGNLWPRFRGEGPFYDSGARYTVPYTVFSSGVGWQSDLVRPADAPSATANPFDIFWNPRYRGRVGVYDEYREALGLALVHEGVRDLNTTDPSTLATAADSLIDMARAVDVRATTDGAYEGLPKGEFAVHQAWSGDILSAPRFGGAPASTPLLRYWWPSGGTGVVGVDLLAIPTRGRNPVLAHAFLNHLMDPGVAMANFAWNGYQPPVLPATIDALSSLGSPARRVVPENLRPALLTPDEFDQSTMLLPLAPAADELWISAWERFTASIDVTG